MLFPKIIPQNTSAMRLVAPKAAMFPTYSPKLFSKAAPESCSPKLLPKAAPQNCVLKLLPKGAPHSKLLKAAPNSC